MKHYTRQLLAVVLSIFASQSLLAQNPFIRDQFTADPSARVFGDSVYVYPSHDILAKPGKGRVGWFCMEDYHVFSSANLTDWKDHGVIVSQNNVPWVKRDSYSMWAPDCIFKNGKYYFYFPTTPKDTINGKGFTIGVATASKPTGPFTPQPESIKKVRGIDPNVFIDKDGQAYLYWSAGNIFGAKLTDNMLELATEPLILGDLPSKGLKEGPYMIEQNGIYYLTYPHVENKIERLEYAIGNSPLGPFKVTGVIMDESPTGCWTNHHSIIQYKGQSYLFYHHNDYSPKFDKSRSIRVDSLFFNADGTIKKVKPTLRGVGITKATQKIEIDRYSDISKEGATIAFLDTAHTFNGWKTQFDSKGAWIKYNSVDFGKKKLKSVSVKAMAYNGGKIQIRKNAVDGKLLAEINVPATEDWKMIKAPLKVEPGIQNLVIVSTENTRVEVDWIQFE